MLLILTLIHLYKVKKYNEEDKKYRKQRDKTSGLITELVRGIRDIKMLNAEKSFMGELKDKIVDLNTYRYNWVKYERGYRFILGSVNDIFDFFSKICGKMKR